MGKKIRNMSRNSKLCIRILFVCLAFPIQLVAAFSQPVLYSSSFYCKRSPKYLLLRGGEQDSSMKKTQNDLNLNEHEMIGSDIEDEQLQVPLNSNESIIENQDLDATKSRSMGLSLPSIVSIFNLIRTLTSAAVGLL